MKIGGVELRVLARVTAAAHEKHQPHAVPERLRPGELRLVMGSGKVQLATYSEIDPLSVPRTLVDVLHHFDCRPTAAVVKEIEAVHDLRLKPGLVRKLVDFNVLRGSEDEPAPG